MTMPRPARLRLSALIAAALLTQPGMARREAKLGQSFDVGLNNEGDNCHAVISWRPHEIIAQQESQPYSIECGTQTQALGRISRQASDIQPEGCGDEVSVALGPLGTSRARRCKAAAGIEQIEITAGAWKGVADRDELAPLVMALAHVNGRPVDPAQVSPRRYDAAYNSLPQLQGAARAVAREAAPVTEIHQQIALGLANIRAGNNVEASRFLDTAIANYADAPPSQQAELRLTAALAASNIGAFPEAEEHLDAAQKLLEQDGAVADRLPIYRALHLVNQSKFQEAVLLLDGTDRTAGPLKNATTLARLNRFERPSLNNQSSQGQLEDLTLDVQGQIALSTALLRIGRISGSNAALHKAADLTQEQAGPGSLNTGLLNWLLARLDRQNGRILAAKRNFPAALRSLDCAIAELNATPQPRAGGCMVVAEISGTALSGPVVAEAQLEKAALRQRAHEDPVAVMSAYEEALQTLKDHSTEVAAASPLLAPYLHLLAAAGDRPSAEKFFAALQTTRSPGVAREYAEMLANAEGGERPTLARQVKSADNKRIEIEAQIANLQAGDPEKATLSSQLNTVSEQHRIFQQELNKLPPLGAGALALDDTPISLTELQQSLRPGEGYWRLVKVGERLFGAFVTRDQYKMYEAISPAAGTNAAAQVSEYVKAVSNSLTSNAGTGELKKFALKNANLLFTTLAGPAAPLIRSVGAIAVDSSELLQNVPAAVLIDDGANLSVPHRDYRKVAFLARRAALSTALSPNAFVHARALTPSTAPRPLVGFGETSAAPPAGPGQADAPVSLSSTCQLPYGEWVQYHDRFPPISADEIREARREIGSPDAPIYVGADFTNAAMKQRSDRQELVGYQILHFATHGIPGQKASEPHCAGTPPSLLSSIGASSTGLLTYTAIQELELNANLVVLAACDTASGTFENGRLGGQQDASGSLDGLVRAFLVARARAVLATHWAVDDDAARALVGAFYHSGRTHNMAEALRQAQMAVLDRDINWSHPYYWAPFFLVGDGTKMMLSPPAAVAARN